MTARFPHLFEPIRLGPLEVKNRVAMTAHGMAANTTPRGLRYVEARARGGVGLMCINGLNVGVGGYTPSPGRYIASAASEFDNPQPDPTTPEGIAFYDDRVIPQFREMAALAHRYGAVVVSQIHHLGSSPVSDSLLAAVGPSAVRDEEFRYTPHVLDEQEIADLVLAYGHSARRGREAGLDGVELHAAHGYLINQFLSPYTNHRTDRYGGSFEKRLLFLREIVASIDRLAGRDFPVGIRINGDERAEGGLTPADVARVASAFADRFIYVNVSGGTTTGRRDGISLAYASPWLEPLGYNVPSASEIRKGTSLPVIATGKVIHPEQAERILAGGDADMVGMARALFADPEWVSKAQTGREEDIRPCIGTLECHALREGGRVVGVRCAVNPQTGREVELEIVPATTKRRVLVAGGGPAGMQAAITAAQRGHQVVLCERDGELGGQARAMAGDPTHEQLRMWLRYLARSVRQAGVEVRLGAEVTPDFVAAGPFDAVIVATGARPSLPAIEGIGQANVTTASDVLLGKATVGRRVLVVAGLDEHLGPLSVADVLAQRGHEVEVTSEAMTVGEGVDPRALHQVLKRLLLKDVKLSPLTAVRSIEGTCVRTRNVMTRRDGAIEGVDTIVIASAGASVDDLAHSLKGSRADVHTIGDALAPRRIIHAVLEGSRIGVQV